MKTAKQIAGELGAIEIIGDGNVVVSGITHDSRQVGPGQIFAVMKGEKVDGRRFVPDAIAQGAAALLVEEPLDVSLCQLRVDSVRERLGSVAAACYGYPTQTLKTAAVTGTNGKTTVTYIVESALKAAGQLTGVMGTVDYRVGDQSWAAEHTTPEATVVQRIAREMSDKGASHLVMETSSHGLSLGRLNGCHFDVVAFTNLTQDHLDFHGSMEEYAGAKLLLFTDALEGNADAKAVVNVDDPYGATVLNHLKHPALTVSVDAASTADIKPMASPVYSINGVEVRLTTPFGAKDLVSPLLGAHNLSNLLVAFGICVQLGLEPDLVLDVFKGGPNVPGRLERVPRKKGPAVLVDYAHTPDALVRVLDALRPLTSGRLMCVFGCGGDRDPIKRPLMAGAVAAGADLAFVTSDNPRTEDPLRIIEMILPGLEEKGLRSVDPSGVSSCSRGYCVDSDRRAAIALAIRAARPEDTVLIAGKGHEDYQILGTQKVHFDDREEAERVLATLDGGGGG